MRGDAVLTKLQEQDWARLQACLRRLDLALEAGKVGRAAYHKQRRRQLHAYERLVKRRKREKQYAGRFKRALRNMARWEARTGYPGTTPWMDEWGGFHYWDFQRNEAQFWGGTRNRITFRKRR